MEKTRIIVHIDSTQPLFLRGEGVSSLSWDKGIELQHVKEDEWVWETDESFSNAQFKILLNDQTMELGDSHPLYPGASMRINPKFPD